MKYWNEIENKENGITLIALIITIIILVILAAVSIRAVTNMRIVDYAINGTQNYVNAGKTENKTLDDAASFIEGAIGKIDKIQNQKTGPTGKPLVNKTTVADYVTGTKLEGEDKFGNPITIPVGFKVAEDSGEDVTQGIVIEDNDTQTDGNGNQRGNQYVWIPTGTIYTDTAMTEANAKEIIAGRYEFADGTSSYVDENNETVTGAVKGTPVLKQRLTNYAVQPTDIVYSGSSSPDFHKITSATNGQIVTNNYYYEVLEYRAGVANNNTTGLNRTAASLSSFATSVASNHGYYIARYEASWGTGDKVKSRVSVGTPLTAAGTRTNGQLWNFVTEIDAAGYCQNLYASINSDLMNSYAWDTAIVYIQTFSGDTDYSYQTSKNTSGPANTGVNGDKVCNIHDMASNDLEWTTEYSTYQNSSNAYPCVRRGGIYNSTNNYTARRYNYGAAYSDKSVAFRPTLYL